MTKRELKEKTNAAVRLRVADKEKADDFKALLGALPPGQVKNLLKDEKCGEILRKHGIVG